jgi:hypothetical protein
MPGRIDEFGSLIRDRPAGGPHCPETSWEEKIGSCSERGTNLEFRVQKANAPADPTPPRRSVLRVLLMRPIV